MHSRGSRTFIVSVCTVEQAEHILKASLCNDETTAAATAGVSAREKEGEKVASGWMHSFRGEGGEREQEGGRNGSALRAGERWRGSNLML